ncbi:MAG: MotA/TolQ/ExbB proton channel family protein [Verrucomicrobia bacterium]|nr:MotA/TolQ/ExbB proton channel family protein [Verrucomicrobiota bacterium]
MPTTILERIVTIWTAGGWVMFPLLALCILMFFLAARLLSHINARGFLEVGEDEWMDWIHHPERGRGEVGEMIRYTQDEARSADDIHARFAEVACGELPVIDRRLSTLNTVVAAAPLVGLLGTVFGMLVTFQALASGGGGKVTEAMAAGISQALFPPEVGLCIALPGLVLVQLIRRRRQEYAAFLARVESRTVQNFRKQLPAEAQAPDQEAFAGAGRITGTAFEGVMAAPVPA